MDEDVLPSPHAIVSTPVTPEQDPQLLALLSDGGQLQLAKQWAEGHFHPLEAQLQRMLEAGGGSATGAAVHNAHALLRAAQARGSAMLPHVCDGARRLLFGACRHAWLSSWASVDERMLPEPCRTEVSSIESCFCCRRAGWMKDPCPIQ